MAKTLEYTTLSSNERGHFVCHYKFPLRDVVKMESRGFRRLKRRSYVYWAHVKFAGVVPLLLYRAGTFDIQRKKRGLESSSPLCVRDSVPTDANTAVRPFVR